MLSLALDPQAVASAWERVGASIFSGPAAELEDPAGIKLDLSCVEATLRPNHTSFSNDCCDAISLHQKGLHDGLISLKSMDCASDMCDPMHSWNCLMPINLSGAPSSQAPGDQQPASSASDGSHIMRVPDCAATCCSNEADGATAPQPATSARAPTVCESGSKTHPHPADSSTAQHQLSRANSLLAVVPDAPSSPQCPAHSGSSSGSSCADRVAAVATPASSPAALSAVQEVVAAAPASAESSGPLSPRAAMAAAAAAATAAMQKRLREQQKLGKQVAMPGISPTASSITAGVHHQQQQASSAAEQGSLATTAAVAVQAAAHSAISTGAKRSFSTMVNGLVKPVAAAVALPARPAAGFAAAAAASSEVFVRTRAEALARYRVKRARRSHAKKIRYHLRKINADKRPRIKGRFVSKDEMEKLGLLVPEFDEQPIAVVSTCKPASAHTAAAAEQLEAAAAPSGLGGGFCWEEQMQQMHLIGSDMAEELLLKYDDHHLDHHMHLPTAVVAADVAASAVTPATGQGPSAADHLLLPHELHYTSAVGLSAGGDELPGFTLDLAGVDSMHFGEDYLNDEASDISHGHHDLLML